MGEAAAKGPVYQYTPTGWAFHNSNAFVRGVRGPIGSGKSSLCCIEIIAEAMAMPADKTGSRRSRVAAIRNTNKQLKDTTFQTWTDWCEDFFGPTLGGEVHLTDFIHKVRFPMADGTNVKLDVYFRALDKPDDVKNLQSLELTGAWLNEAIHIPFEILAMAEGRVGRYPSHRQVKSYRSYVILDTNPPDSSSWWYNLAEEIAPRIAGYRGKTVSDYQGALAEITSVNEDFFDFGYLDDEQAAAAYEQILYKYDFYSQPSGLSSQAENTAFLEPGYYTRMMAGKSEEWINVYIHGKYGFLIDGRAVYPEYNDRTHFNPRLLNADENIKLIFRGWDGGRTPAVTFGQLSPDGRKFQLFDEICADDMGLVEFGDVVNRHSATNYMGHKFVDICDPAVLFRGQLDDRVPALVLAAKGVQFQAGIQSPKIRKEAVKKLLRELNDGMPAFQIGPKCVKTRKGLMGGYHYKRKQVSGVFFHDKPDKNEYSHPVESLEYICTKLFSASVLDDEFSYGEAPDEFDMGFDKDTAPTQGRNQHTGY